MTAYPELQRDVVPLTLLGAWAPYADTATYGVPTLYADRFGGVRLVGLIAGGVVGTAALAIPPMYMPEFLEYFQGVSYNGTSYVVGGLWIDTATSQLSVANGGNVFVSLDQCAWRAKDMNYPR